MWTNNVGEMKNLGDKIEVYVIITGKMAVRGWVIVGRQCTS